MVAATRRGAWPARWPVRRAATLGPSTTTHIRTRSDPPTPRSKPASRSVLGTASNTPDRRWPATPPARPARPSAMRASTPVRLVTISPLPARCRPVSMRCALPSVSSNWAVRNTARSNSRSARASPLPTRSTPTPSVVTRAAPAPAKTTSGATSTPRSPSSRHPFSCRKSWPIRWSPPVARPTSTSPSPTPAPPRFPTLCSPTFSPPASFT